MPPQTVGNADAAPSTRSVTFAFLTGAIVTGVLCAALWVYGFGLDVLAWGAAGAFKVAVFVALLTSTACGIAFGLTLHAIRKKASVSTSTRPRLKAGFFGAAAFLTAIGVHFMLPTSILSSVFVFAVVGVAAAAVYRSVV